MKKKLLLTTLIALVATSCGSNRGSSSFTSTTNLVSETTNSSLLTSTSSSSEVNVRYWNENELGQMNDFLGFTLPCPNFTVQRAMQLNEDEEGKYLYIYAEYERESVFNEYKDILTANGFKFYSIDSSFGYDLYLYVYHFQGEVYALQTGYLPAANGFAPRLEIFAWKVESGSSDSNSDGEVLKSYTYPEIELNDWLNALGVTATVPSFEASYYQYTYSETLFEIACSDFGTPGEDAIEDSYLVSLEEAGWTIDASLYDYSGYFAYSPDGKLLTRFYSYNGIFYVGHSLNESGNIGGSSESTSETYPQNELNEWLASFGLSVEIPTFEADMYTWEINEDVFSISCADLGTIGVDSIEDTHKANLAALGWTVDDTYYEIYGYYAYSPDTSVVALFSTYDGEFFVSYFANTASEGEMRNYPTFPKTQLDSFLEEKGLTCPVPTFEEKTGYGYNSAVMPVEGISDEVFVIQTYDYGTPGQDAIEDTYKQALEQLGWVIDSTNYDELGYVASYPDSNAQIIFYTYDSYFTFLLYTL